MDGIKNMDQLYTRTTEYSQELGCEGTVESYCGDIYCKSIISALPDWQEARYIGSPTRVSNETFILASEIEYKVSFTIDTYDQKIWLHATI